MNPLHPLIRPYTPADKKSILTLFRLNTPHYFSPDEEKDLLLYLEVYSTYFYVIEYSDAIAGCGGYAISEDQRTGVICWDIFHPGQQQKGFGTILLNYRLTEMRKLKSIQSIIVRTSQLAYKFYERNGFILLETKKDYWAEGFDLYKMVYDPDAAF